MEKKHVRAHVLMYINVEHIYDIHMYHVRDLVEASDTCRKASLIVHLHIYKHAYMYVHVCVCICLHTYIFLYDSTVTFFMYRFI